MRFHYHHLYGQVYRGCQAYSVELFICGESRIWSVFQAARSKRSGWSRPLWCFRSQKLAERRCPCEPLDGFTLTVIIFEKQLSTTRFVFMIWVSQASSGEVSNMYIKFAQCGGIDGTPTSQNDKWKELAAGSRLILRPLTDERWCARKKTKPTFCPS